MTIQSKLEAALPYLPQTVQHAVKRLPDPMQIQELRLRIGRPVQIVRQTGRTVLLLPNGQPVTADRQMIDTVFHNICAHSVHSWQDAIRQGFITIAGGSRVGLCGTAVMQQGILETVRAVSGMNIRIASERIGCADALFSRLGNRIAAGGLLIAGAPNSGKTTLLRDLARILGESHRICLLDARGELAAVQGGVPQFEIGAQTDVFDGYPKAAGMEIAVRVMSPEIIITDELGNSDETEMLLQSLHTGVQFIASAHAGSLSEITARPQLRRLIEAGAFRTGILLGSGAQTGQITEIRRLEGDAA